MARGAAHGGTQGVAREAHLRGGTALRPLPGRGGVPLRQLEGKLMALEWKKILCPVDFSDASRSALQVASELARRFDGEVTVFHAYPLPGYTLPEGSVLPASGMLQELAEQTDALLARWKAEAIADGAPKVE